MGSHEHDTGNGTMDLEAIEANTRPDFQSLLGYSPAMIDALLRWRARAAGVFGDPPSWQETVIENLDLPTGLPVPNGGYIRINWGQSQIFKL